MAKTFAKLAELVGRMPDPDGKGMYCENIDKDKIDGAIAEIHEGGRKSILGIIDLLVEPGKGDDVKAHYALHCLGLHICKIKDKKGQRVYGTTLSSQLGGDLPKGVQTYLIQELQSFGGKEAVKSLNSVVRDKELAPAAIMAMLAIRGM